MKDKVREKTYYDKRDKLFKRVCSRCGKLTNCFFFGNYAYCKQCEEEVSYMNWVGKKSKEWKDLLNKKMKDSRGSG